MATQVIGVVESVGRESHQVHVDRDEATSNSPYIEDVHAIIQNALNGINPGVAATVGMERKAAEQKFKEGVTPEELAGALAAAVADNFFHGARKNERIEVIDTVEGAAGDERIVTRVQAVMFTDAQFAEFLIGLEKPIVELIDRKIAEALAPMPGENDVLEGAQRPSGVGDFE